MKVNAKKSNIMIMNVKDHNHEFLYINGKIVEIVHEFNYLGVLLSDDLNLTSMNNSLLEKVSMIHLTLKSWHISKSMDFIKNKRES